MPSSEDKKDVFGNQTSTDANADGQSTDKAGDIAEAAKSKVVESLNSVMDRAKGLLGKLESMASDNQAKGIPSNVAQEIKAMAATLNGILEKFTQAAPSSGGDEDAGEEEEGKAALGEQKKSVEVAAEAVEKAAADSNLSKKDAKALRKLFVGMKDLMMRIHPESKALVKEFDIVIKEMTSDPQVEGMADLVGELRQSNTLNAELKNEMAELRKKFGEQAEHIAKMDRVIPDGNSVQGDGPAPPKSAVTPSEGDDFKFPYCPGNDKKE